MTYGFGIAYATLEDIGECLHFSDFAEFVFAHCCFSSGLCPKQLTKVKRSFLIPHSSFLIPHYYNADILNALQEGVAHTLLYLDGYKAVRWKLVISHIKDGHFFSVANAVAEP